eukprot:CAMPEP_0117666050 /NCGR_PEP_ID=MMETSP0804-20121206/10154_1 /TAXON_ID=1074897 /ORGANISM="Tetraselmis astigmatica, Strain CCMP880" /LENGTH=552 /DNA_ID=CAMNT_0005473539 /DNA_START=30 /DNA_END=1688 /DNA_ORIENTATION=-
MSDPPPEASDSNTNNLFVQRMQVLGHRELTITADPLSRVYPYCIGQSLWTAAAELVCFFNGSVPDEVVMRRFPSVLELGAGLGAPGMALALKGAARVVETDREVMLPLLQFNVLSNFPAHGSAEGPEASSTTAAAASTPAVSVAPLPWGDAEAFEELVFKHGPFSLLIGADVAYDEDLHGALLDTITHCLKHNPDCKVVLSIPDRPESRPFLPRAATTASLGWRVLRRVPAERSPDLQHDCLIVELFPLSSSTCSPPTTAVLCDFDWSLVEENSDTFALECLGAAGFLEELRAAGERSWTRMMDSSLLAAQRRLGATADQVRAACRETPMDSAVIAALRATSEQPGCELHILSDANSVFIAEILARHGLADAFSSIHTNPAEFDKAGALRVSPYHAAPPGCHLCPDNLCKGAVLERLLFAGSFQRIVYVGDGGNDFCPACRCGPWDSVLARRVYPNGRAASLLSKLARSGSIVPMVGWKHAHKAKERDNGPAAGDFRDALASDLAEEEAVDERYTGRAVHGRVLPWSRPAQLGALLQELTPMPTPPPRSGPP